MNLLKKISQAISEPFDLVSAVENHETKKIIRHLESTDASRKPASIPYTADAIVDDLDTLYKFKELQNPTRDEFAAAIAIRMLHLAHRSTMDWLSRHGCSVPKMERMIYIGTFLNTLSQLKEFSGSSSIKKYKIASCGDERVCSVCAKHDGKTYLLSKAEIGKTAPPFCESCRCIIRPVFK